jgi:hypothetical protein
MAEEGEASSHTYYEGVAGEEDRTEAQAVQDHIEAQGVGEEGEESGRKASMVESYEGDAEEKG